MIDRIEIEEIGNGWVVIHNADKLAFLFKKDLMEYLDKVIPE